MGDVDIGQLQKEAYNQGVIDCKESIIRVIELVRLRIHKIYDGMSIEDCPERFSEEIIKEIKIV